jgi:hypothetical protein
MPIMPGIAILLPFPTRAASGKMSKLLKEFMRNPPDRYHQNMVRRRGGL